MATTRAQTQVTKMVHLMLLTREERQSDLAEALSTTQANVSRKLSNKVSWTLDDLDALSRHFNVEPSDLFRSPAELMMNGLHRVGSPERDVAARRHARKAHMHRSSNLDAVRNKWSNTLLISDYALAA